MSFRYVGESSTEYTRGDFYNVIDCGPHWHTNEIVVWITDNGHPETTDVDYCTAFSFDTFLSDFEYDSKYLELINKVEKLQEQLNTAKKALTEIDRSRYGMQFRRDRNPNVARQALAAIGGDDEL
ncbi:hypothetical protein [Lactococcus lactis]|nr:hypothetical protein [Lactococcus lactis]